MARCFVSVGSNIDRERYLRAAIDELKRLYGAVQVSTVYESSAVGFNGDPFLNLVVEFHTPQDVHTVNAALHAIEERHGRDRNGPRFAARTLDLDLLLYDDLVQVDEEVEIPRGDIAEQAFVLCPLAELEPAGKHPLTGKPFAAMWSEFDKRGVDIRPVEFAWPSH